MRTTSLLAAFAMVACSPAVKQVSVEPAQALLSSKGAPLQLHAIAKDAKGTTIPGVPFTWSSGNPAVASVDATGKTLALKSGTAEITAANGTIKGAAEIKVQIPATLAVSPETTALTGIGQTTQLQVTVKDDVGNVIAGATASWTSSTANVATVDEKGAVRSVGAGLATISARSGQLTGTARITVTLPAKARKKAKKHHH